MDCDARQRPSSNVSQGRDDFGAAQSRRCERRTGRRTTMRRKERRSRSQPRTAAHQRASLARSLTSSDFPTLPKRATGRRRRQQPHMHPLRAECGDTASTSEAFHLGPARSPSRPYAETMTITFASLSVNLAVWCAIAYGAGWWHRRTPATRLDHDGRILRLRAFEVGGEWYERRLKIKRWKSHLPETGGRHGGMSKRKLPGRNPPDLLRFAAECRRGERTHWTIVAAGPAFLAWNSPTNALALTVANTAGNAPFLATLRYNRARITATLARSRSTTPSQKPDNGEPSSSRPPTVRSEPAHVKRVDPTTTGTGHQPPNASSLARVNPDVNAPMSGAPALRRASRGFRADSCIRRRRRRSSA
jgi:glycosyl-4,4'-diaponeurosporenoate acyltransferase